MIIGPENPKRAQRRVVITNNPYIGVIVVGEVEVVTVNTVLGTGGVNQHRYHGMCVYVCVS